MSGTEGPTSLEPSVRALLAEDDPTLADALATALRAHGYDVTVAADGAAALALVRAEEFHLAVVEMLLPQASGFLLAQEVRVLRGPMLPVIMLSGSSAVEHRQYADLLGVTRFLTKPFDPVILVAVADLLAPPPR